MIGNPVHGESITDGSTSSGVAVTLYTAGGVAERTLGASEVLHVTDVQMYNEVGGDTFLCADGKVAGEYVAQAALDAKGGIILKKGIPFSCAPGTGLVFFGAGSGRNVCIIEGFIMEG